MAGLTSAGFEPKTLEQIKSELEEDQRGSISTKVNTAAAALFGQLNGIFASKLREVWELAQAVWESQYPDSSVGRSLALVAALTGTKKRGATKSRVTGKANLNAGTYAAGTLIASVAGSPSSRFVSIEDAVNPGPSAADVLVVFEAQSTGPVRANAGTLTVRASAVAGWNSITNDVDADVGRVAEVDTELRARREAEIASQGSTAADAVKADILQNVTNVISVNVIENETDATVDGVPPHALEAIVRGPDTYTSDDDQAVANQIYKSKGGGIRAWGATSKTVTDSHGNAHTIGFTRPADKNVWLEVDVSVDASAGWLGTPSIDDVKQAIADWGDLNLDAGDDVIALRLKSIAIGRTGVVDVPALRLGFSASPVGTSNLTIAVREIARLDTSRILVTVV